MKEAVRLWWGITWFLAATALAIAAMEFWYLWWAYLWTDNAAEEPFNYFMFFFLGYVGLMTFIVAIYYLFWLGRIHKFVNHHIPQRRKPSGGLAVGLMLIPIWNLFWQPYVSWKLATMMCRHQLDEDMPTLIRRGRVLFCSLAGIVCYLAVIGVTIWVMYREQQPLPPGQVWVLKDPKSSPNEIGPTLTEGGETFDLTSDVLRAKVEGGAWKPGMGLRIRKADEPERWWSLDNQPGVFTDFKPEDMRRMFGDKAAQEIRMKMWLGPQIPAMSNLHVNFHLLILANAAPWLAFLAGVKMINVNGGAIRDFEPE